MPDNSQPIPKNPYAYPVENVPETGQPGIWEPMEPEDAQQPEDQPMLEPPDVDPLDALGEALTSSYDAEDDVYNTGNVKLLFGRVNYNEQPDPTQDSNANFIEDLQAQNNQQIDQTIQNLPEGIQGIAEGLQNFNEAITSRHNPMSAAGQLEAAKGLVGGAVEGLVIAPTNLLEWAFTEAAVNIGGQMTGKTREQLEAENPQLFKAQHLEIPDWLKTDTIHGALTNNVTQFAAGWTGVGAVGKLGAVKGIVSGATKAPLVSGTLKVGAELGEEFPAIRAVAQGAIKAAQNAGKAFTVDTVSFDAQEGNLANILAELLGDKPGLLTDVSKYLAVDKNDTEIEGRLKNGITGQFGEVAGIALFNSLNLLKALRNWQGIKGEFKQGSASLQKKATEILQDIENRAQAFDDAWEEIAKQDPNQLLDMLVRKDDLLSEADRTLEVTGVEPATIGKNTSVHIEIITPQDNIQDAAAKVFRGYESIQQHRMTKNQAALENMVEQQVKQGAKAFDKKAFAEDLVSKIKAGEPIDIQKEILDHTAVADLTDIESYVENFKTILEATTTKVKRYESNKDLLTRVKEILAVDLGQEGWAVGIDRGKLNGELHNAFESLAKRGIKSLTQDEEALLEMMSLKLLSKHLIPNQMALLGAARFEAKVANNTSLLNTVDEQLQALYKAQKEADALFTKYLSNAGRRLQAGGQAETTLTDATEFMETFAKAKKGFPLLTQGGESLSDAELDALAVASRDFFGMGGVSQVGTQNKIGKHLNMFLKALGTASLKSGKYTLGVAQELFYNNVLASFETLKAIGFSNAALKTNELLASGIGAVAKGDMDNLLRTKDEAEAFIRYMAEGFGAGLSVLRTGAKHTLDYTPPNPRVISSEGLRQYFGNSIGDVLKMDVFGFQPGSFADKVVDLAGTVLNLPTAHFIGGIDTAFRVANTRAILWAELKQYARFQNLDEVAAREFAATNIDKITEDLIIARSHEFKGDVPLTQDTFTLQQLKNLNEKIMGNTDQTTLSHPLRSAANPYLDPGASYQATNSDRWVFRLFSKVNDITQMTGLIGTWEMPFIKTFANGVQYGVDSIPIVNYLSPHNRAILRGEMGGAAQENLLGKTFLGAVLGVAGIGAANMGLLAPIAGSTGAKKNTKQLTGEDQYTVKFPVGYHKAITLNFNKGTPLVDGLFLSGRLFQLSHEAREGNIDPAAATFASITMLGESFSSARFLRGLSVSLDSFLNPSYSTADNFSRNIQGSFLYNILPLGGRGWRNITRFTDPVYRDYKNLGEYIQSQFPWSSQHSSPTYDMFGNPRPSEDYIGTTNTLAVNATRLLTPIGIKYVQDDPLAKEIERFGTLGQSLTPPNKNLGVSGVLVPLDQYKNDKGESLWDAYNQELQNYKVPSVDGSGKELTLREYLNETIESDDYKNYMKDNEVSKVTGKRQVILGSRWAEIAAIYQEAKDTVKDIILDDENYLTQYRNLRGDSLEKVLDDALENKERLAE